MGDEIVKMEEADYGKILLRAVAVIDETRTTAARTLIGKSDNFCTRKSWTIAMAAK